MSARPVRMLHAADLRLDLPLRGLGNLPDDLAAIVDGATLLAWDRLATLAIDREVDAVLLTGNCFDAAQASLSAEVTLRNSLARLDEQGIPVVVVPGSSDPAASWRDFPGLPENLIVFEDENDAPIEITDNGRLLATVFPVTAETAIEPPELDSLEAGHAPQRETAWNVGVLLPNHHRAVNDSVSRLLGKFASLHYLACHYSTTDDELPLTEGLVFRQWGPQGLDPHETGPRGGTLVEFESGKKVRTHLMPVAPVRFERMSLSTVGVSTQDDLLERVMGQLEALSDQPGEQLRVITWCIEQPHVAGWNLAEGRDRLALRDQLMALTDNPKQLRWWHLVEAHVPFEAVQDVPHPDLWHEYRRSLTECLPVTSEHLQLLLHEADLKDGPIRHRFDRALETCDMEQVAEAARRQGWRWLVGSGGTASR